MYKFKEVMRITGITILVILVTMPIFAAIGCCVDGYI